MLKMEDQVPASMDRHLDVLEIHPSGGLLIGASSLTGRYWYGSLWFYTSPDGAPDVDKCSAGVQLEAGLRDATWVDPQHIFVGLDTGGVAVWELSEDNKVFTMRNSACEHDNMTSSVSVSCDKSKLYSASYDNSIKVWNPDLTPLHTYNAHSDIVWSLQSHPTESALFLSCSQDGRVVVWDTRDSKPASVVGWDNPSGNSPTCVRWQPSQRNMFAVADEGGSITVQDLRLVVEKTVCYQPHNRFITRLAFCPQRPNLLASISEDCKVVVASVGDTEAQPQYRSADHTDFVCGVTWNSENKLLSAGYDGRVLQHTIDKADTNVSQVNGDFGHIPQPEGPSSN